MDYTKVSREERERLHEINRYDDDAFPIGMYVVTRDGMVPEGRGYRDLHWHEEIQLTMALEGSLLYRVNGEDHILNKGDIIFINKNILHVVDDLSEDGKYVSFNFRDTLLGFFAGSRMEQEDVLPYTSQYAFSALHIQGKEPWERRVQEIVNDLYDIMLHKENTKRMNYRVAMLFTEIWYEIICNLDDEKIVVKKGAIRNQERIQTMLLFIHKYYSENIALYDIAKNANISEGECCRCFKNMVQKSPMQYVMDYRISRAAELLMDTQYSITEISGMTGFTDTSHFIKYFKRKIGLTPKQYRKSDPKEAPPK